jgi:hypothetical protein
MTDTFTLNQIWAQDKIHILVGALLNRNTKLSLLHTLNFTKVYRLLS